MRALSLQTVSGEPLTGLYIGPGGIAFTSRGLPAKGIIAAIDGLAVTTWEQYRALRQEPRGTRRLLLWNEGGWREVEVAIPGDEWDGHIGKWQKR